MSTRRIIASAFGALLVASAPAPVAAQVVYTNGAPNGQAGFDIFNDYRAADDITVKTALTFDLIRFWALLPTGGTSAPIFWQILTDAGGIPGGTAVASGSVVATPTLRASLPFGFDSWQLDLSVGPQVLGPGIFWLALHDGALGDITDSTLLWEMTGSRTGSDFAVDFIPATEWTGNWGGDLAFQLQSSTPETVTPEPATITLVATGILVVVAGRRRRRQR